MDDMDSNLEGESIFPCSSEQSKNAQELMNKFKACPERRGKLDPGPANSDVQAPATAGNSLAPNVSDDYANERILEEARRILEEVIEHPVGDVVKNYASKQVGDRFEFGHYPQGAKGEIEPIIWRVLKRDNDSLLVISEKGLDAQPYNKKWVDIAWSKCTLRTWLNDKFFSSAFNEQEQSLIGISHLTNNAGPSTQDRIFVLSIDEASNLFANDDDRVCEPTDYALKNGAYIHKGTTSWWLRSRGFGGPIAAYVCRDGFVSAYGYGVTGPVSVRPAFRLALK